MSQYCRDLPSTKLSCRKSLVRVPILIPRSLLTRVGLHTIIHVPCHATLDTNVQRLRLPTLDRKSALSRQYLLYSAPWMHALIRVCKWDQYFHDFLEVFIINLATRDFIYPIFSGLGRPQISFLHDHM